jgi:hypothetical protein
MHRGQADAAAFELGGGMKALEGREQLGGVGAIEAHAVVGTKKTSPSASWRARSGCTAGAPGE